VSGSVDLELDSGVARITLNAPGRHNALTTPMMEQLIAHCDRARDDEDVRAIVIGGAGGSFCAGGDLREFAVEREPAHCYFDTRTIARMFRALAETGVPAIAAVRGHCIGMGLGVALSCDLVVAGDDAEFSAPEVEIGLFPFMIAPIVRRTVPRLAVNSLFLLNERVLGERLVQYGMANRVVPADQVDAVAGDWARELSDAPRAMLRTGLDAHRHADGLSYADELTFMQAQLPVATVNQQTREALTQLLAGGDNERGA
jgi:enoyl-CoA hydratase/carnithine racemase